MYDEINKTLKEFSAEGERVYSYAYTAGYYEGVLLDLLMQVTPEQRAAVLRQLNRSIGQLKAKETV